MSLLQWKIEDIDFKFDISSIINRQHPKQEVEPLSFLFEFMSLTCNMMEEHVFLPTPKFYPLLKGKISNGSQGHLDALLELIQITHPLILESPFEGSNTIGGGVWKGDALKKNIYQDCAILKLRFKKGTLDLPSHLHPSSNRVIIITQGKGNFHYSNNSYNEFDSKSIHTIEVSKGDVLFFPQGFIHTFSAKSTDLYFLSFHKPFYELDDEIQYTLTKEKWTPKKTLI